MGRNSHDGASPVTHQHVVGHEHRDRSVIDRVGGVDAREDTRLFPGLCLTFHIRLGCRLCAIGCDGLGRTSVSTSPRIPGPIGPLSRHNPVVQQGVLGGNHHEGGAKQCVGSRGEHLQIVCAGNLEGHGGSTGLADPVALHQPHLLRPVNLTERLSQTIRVGRDTHVPLAQLTGEHWEVAALRAAL